MIRITALFLLALALPAAAQTIDSLPPFGERFAGGDPLKASKRNTAPMLKPAATVTGEIVRIGDLIDNAGDAADEPIFRAPDLGESGSVSAARIAEAVMMHGIVVLDTRGLTDVIVTRASQAIAPDEIEARIARALAGRQQSADASHLTVTFDGEVRAIHVEPGTDLRIVRLSYEPRSGRFDVMFERPGRARGLIRYTGTYAEAFTAAVLMRSLAPGEAVRAADIKIMRRPKAEYSPDTVTQPEQAIGLAPRRALRAGQVLRQSDLAKQEAVARNDGVTITYEVPGIVLTMSGKALEGGAKGDLINVLNVHSKRTIQATVAGPGHVIAATPARVGVAPAAHVVANAPVASAPKTRPNAE